MKVLVTGATGFVGSELVRQLLAEGADVRILRREGSGFDLLGGAAAHVEHAVGDVTEPESVMEAMAGVDRVFHTAAHIGFQGRSGWEALRRVNVEGTANVVDAALRQGVRRLVHTSSMAAFGRTENATHVIDERSEWQESAANSRYARSKYLAELEVYRGVAEGLDAVIVNPALIFGLGRPGDNTMQIVEKVRRRKLPAIPPGGTNVVDVADVAAGLLRAMDIGKSGERYFLGSENLWWREIICALADAFGVDPPRWAVSARVAMGVARVSEAVSALTRTRPLITRETARTTTRFYRYSNRRAVEELGLTFRPFRETVEQIAGELGERERGREGA